MAVMKETKPPTVVWLAADCRATMVMITASATAAISWTMEVLAAAAAAYFMPKRRTRFALSWKRGVSCSAPPKILTTFWQSMPSCSTWVTSPIACCTSRPTRRRRRLNRRTISVMPGTVTRVMRVSCQFRYSSQPSRPAMVMLSLSEMVTAEVAAEVTWVTSKVTLDTRLPLTCSS